MQYIKNMQTVLFGLVFMCGAVAVLAWLWHTVDRSGDELLSNIQIIENQRVFENNLSQLQTIIEDTTEQRELLQNYILKDENDTIRLLSKLDAMALQQNVDLSTQSLEVVEGEGIFDTLAVTFVVSGNEATVRKVIKMFETLPYHGEIQKLTYANDSVDEFGQKIADATISLLLTISNYDQ